MGNSPLQFAPLDQAPAQAAQPAQNGPLQFAPLDQEPSKARQVPMNVPQMVQTQQFDAGTPKNTPGMMVPGNIDLNNRPVVQNADGSHSSEYSTSFEDEHGREVLVPTIVNGKFLTPDGKKPAAGSPEEKAMMQKAKEHYIQTGQHMGVFSNPASADAYANKVHNRGQQQPIPGADNGIPGAAGPAAMGEHEKYSTPRSLKDLWHATTDELADFTDTLIDIGYQLSPSTVKLQNQLYKEGKEPVHMDLNKLKTGLSTWNLPWEDPSQSGHHTVTMPSLESLSGDVAVKRKDGSVVNVPTGVPIVGMMASLLRKDDPNGNKYDVEKLLTGVQQSGGKAVSMITSPAMIGTELLQPVMQGFQAVKAGARLGQESKYLESAHQTAKSVADSHALIATDYGKQVVNAQETLDNAIAARNAAEGEADIAKAQQQVIESRNNLHEVTKQATQAQASAESSRLAAARVRFAADKTAAQLAENGKNLQTLGGQIAANLPQPLLKTISAAQKGLGYSFSAQALPELMRPRASDEAYADYLDRIMNAGSQVGFGAAEAGGDFDVAKDAIAKGKSTLGAIGDAVRNRLTSTKDDAWKNNVAQNDAMKKFMTAIKPGKGRSNYNEDDYWAMRPFLEDSHAQENISSAKDVANAVESQRQGLDNQVKGQVEKFKNEPLDNGKNVDGTDQTLLQKVAADLHDSNILTAGFSDEGLTALNKYDLDNMSLGKADALRRQLNNVVREKLAKSFWDVSRLAATDPEFAATLSLQEHLRDGVYGTMEKLGIDGAREARQLEVSAAKIRYAADAQEKNDKVVRRGTGDTSPAGKAMAWAVKKLGIGAGVAIGGATKIPGAAEAGGMIAAGPSEAASQAISRPDQTVQQLIEQSMQVTGAPRGEFRGVNDERVTKTPATEAPLHPMEDSELHDKLKAYYGKEDGDMNSDYVSLARRVESDIRLAHLNGLGNDTESVPKDLRALKVEIAQARTDAIKEAKERAAEEAELKAKDAKEAAKEGPKIEKAEEEYKNASPEEKKKMDEKLAQDATKAAGKELPKTDEEAAKLKAEEEEESPEEMNAMEEPEMKRNYTFRVRRMDGSTEDVTVPAFSRKKAFRAALKQAQKPGAGGTAASTVVGASEVESTNAPEDQGFNNAPKRDVYTVDKGKLHPLGSPSKSDAAIQGHELGHALRAYMSNGRIVPDRMITRTHPGLRKGGRAAVTMDYEPMFGKNGKFDPSKMGPEDIQHVLETMMAGIAHDEIHNGVDRANNPNNAVSGRRGNDRSLAHKILRDAGVPEDQIAGKVEAALDSVKEKLNHPVTRGIVAENMTGREKGLSTQFMMSKARMDSIWNEHQRRMAEYEQQANNQRGGGETVVGNEGLDTGAKSRLPVQAGQGVPGTEPAPAAPAKEVRPRYVPGAPVATGVVERTTGVHDEAIRAAGGVPAGTVRMGGKTLVMWHDPQTGATLGAYNDEPITPEIVGKQIDDSRAEFAKNNRLPAAAEMKESDEEPAQLPAQWSRDLSPAEKDLFAETHGVSARNPSGKGATENPNGSHLTIDREAINKTPGLPEKVAGIVKDTPGLELTKEERKNPQQVMDKFVRHIADNYKYLYNRVAEAHRNLTAQWYGGANRIANEHAQEFGITPQQAAAVIAVHSPQNEWFNNISSARRTNNEWKNHQNTPWDEKMSATAKRLTADGGNATIKGLLPQITGKTLAEVGQTAKGDPNLAQAAWLRIHDESQNDVPGHREYQTYLPTGDLQGRVERTGKNGEIIPGTAHWNSLDPIAKAISVLKDGSRENISDKLGDEHKVRSFYNNMATPYSKFQHVTSDTHNVAAGLLRPLGGNDDEVAANFGTKSFKSKPAGVSGTYALYGDGLRTAAKELGIEHPSMLQSIVWEEIREMFPQAFKTDGTKKVAKDVWKEVTKGNATPDEARERIAQLANTWHQVNQGVMNHDEGRASNADYNKAARVDAAVAKRQAAERAAAKTAKK